MKKRSFQFISLMALTAMMSTTSLSAKELKVGIVNFKECVENSKLGKQEQGNFEALKKQMESVLEEKEKQLNDLATKLNDNDYLDSISADAETELKRKARAIQGDLQQHQQQFYQALQQANFKVVQQLTDAIGKASKKLASNQSFDMILNEEVAFFANAALNVSKDVVKEMDTDFATIEQNQEKEQLKKKLPGN
jgi:Outer membrane protein